MNDRDEGDVALRAATLMVLAAIALGLLAWYGTLSGPSDVASLVAAG